MIPDEALIGAAIVVVLALLATRVRRKSPRLSMTMQVSAWALLGMVFLTLAVVALDSVMNSGVDVSGEGGVGTILVRWTD